MKIIRVDNFNRESVSDVLIAENVLDFYVEHLVDKLNEKFGGYDAPFFYKSVDNDYELYEFKP